MSNGIITWISLNIPMIIKLKKKKKEEKRTNKKRERERAKKKKLIFEEEKKLAWGSWKVSLLLDGGRIGSTNWILNETIWNCFCSHLLQHHSTFSHNWFNLWGTSKKDKFIKRADLEMEYFGREPKRMGTTLLLWSQPY